MPRPSPSSNKIHESPSASASSAEAPDQDFLRSTAYIPESIDDGPIDSPSIASSPDPALSSVVPPELIAQALGPSFQALFRAVASKRGQHWELQEFEKTALVQGWTPIVQILLAKLGNSEQVMLTLAMASTAAIVGGKVAQEATRRVSSTASTRTHRSGDSSASSASVGAARQPEQNYSFEERDEL